MNIMARSEIGQTEMNCIQDCRHRWSLTQPL